MSRISRTRRIVLFFLAASLIAAVAAVRTAAWLIGAAAPRVFSSLEDVPAREAGLLLGAPKYYGGRPSPVLEGRIQAAAALYRAGKVRRLVVSGANRPDEFIYETVAMKRGLIALGVPEDAVVEDDKGLRTLDSVLRMRDVFGYDGFITISQRDHCERALYLADHHGISTVGFAAETAPGMTLSDHAAGALREPLARVKAVLDVATGRRAKYPSGR